MGFYVTVEPGDYLSKIAAEYGFADFHVIWDAPENADLRRRRGSPDILYPGDRIYIPAPDAPPADDGKSVTVATGHPITVVVRRTRPRLRLKMCDALGKPLANAAAEVTVDGETRDLSTDGDGMLDVDLRPDSSEASVVVGQVGYDLRIGGLDPAAETTGLVARLRNLGYLDADSDEPDPEAIAFALALLGADNHLGGADQARGQVEDVYGC